MRFSSRTLHRLKKRIFIFEFSNHLSKIWLTISFFFIQIRICQLSDNFSVSNSKTRASKKNQKFKTVSSKNELFSETWTVNDILIMSTIKRLFESIKKFREFLVFKTAVYRHEIKVSTEGTPEKNTSPIIFSNPCQDSNEVQQVPKTSHHKPPRGGKYMGKKAQNMKNRICDDNFRKTWRFD